ncbi:MAG TPA: carbohydrate kinase family protein [Candidatus Saccharimonadales bacterium]
MAQKQLDVLAIGDVVTDVFIKLLDNEAKVEKTDDGPRLSMAFATKIPFDHATIVPAVGNASNAAVCIAKVGLQSGLVSNIGDDDWGRDILRALHNAKVDRRFVHINPKKKSNYHYVLWYREDRTILIKHEEYDYNWPRFRSIDIPRWIYFSSVSQHALGYHDELAQWLERHPEIKLVFQPGTFQLEAGAQRLRRIYVRSEILAVNRQEAAEIAGKRYEDDIHELLDKLHELGPKIVLVSDGPKGAYASDGASRYKMPIYPDPKPPYDRTGAGDAFSSTFVAAVIRGADIAGALLWAPINAMSVVQKVGAQAGLLTDREIEHYLRIAPEDYRPVRLG